MIAAVTGASGHVGANLVRGLLAKGQRVRVLIYQRDRAIEDLDVERVHGDVLHPESLDPLTAGADTVYHLAARISLTGRDEAQVNGVNVGGTHHVVEACKRARVRRLVHFSSIHAFSPQPAQSTIDEERVLNDNVGPIYDRSKAAGENVVRAAIEAGMDAVIVNPTAVLGPHDYEPSAMGKVLLDIYHRRLFAMVRGGFNWVDVRDVVAGTLAAANSGERGARYLLGGEYQPLAKLAHLVQTVTGKRRPRFVVPLWVAHAGIPFAYLNARLRNKPWLLTRASLQALCNHSDVSHARATRDLDYAPRPLQDTVQATFDWYREANLL